MAKSQPEAQRDSRWCRDRDPVVLAAARHRRRRPRRHLAAALLLRDHRADRDRRARHRAHGRSRRLARGQGPPAHLRRRRSSSSACWSASFGNAGPGRAAARDPGRRSQVQCRRGHRRRSRTGPRPVRSSSPTPRSRTGSTRPRRRSPTATRRSSPPSPASARRSPTSSRDSSSPCSPRSSSCTRASASGAGSSHCSRKAARDKVHSSGQTAWASLTAFVRATIIVALVDAIGIAFGAWVLGVPLTFAIGVLVFLGAFVPDRRCAAVGHGGGARRTGCAGPVGRADHAGRRHRGPAARVARPAAVPDGQARGGPPARDHPGDRCRHRRRGHRRRAHRRAAGGLRSTASYDIWSTMHRNIRTTRSPTRMTDVHASVQRSARSRADVSVRRGDRGLPRRRQDLRAHRRGSRRPASTSRPSRLTSRGWSTRTTRSSAAIT